MRPRPDIGLLRRRRITYYTFVSVYKMATRFLYLCIFCLKRFSFDIHLAIYNRDGSEKRSGLNKKCVLFYDYT